MIIAITGGKCSGKSASLIRTVQILQSRGVSVGGIVSKRIWKDGERHGYELLNITNGSAQVLATETEPDCDYEKFCSFFFRKQALADGRDAIARGSLRDVLIIDEIGNMEISGGGWSAAFPFIMNRDKPTVISVRESVLGELADVGINPDVVIRLTTQSDDVSGAILSALERES